MVNYIISIISLNLKLYELKYDLLKNKKSHVKKINICK